MKLSDLKKIIREEINNVKEKKRVEKIKSY